MTASHLSPEFVESIRAERVRQGRPPTVQEPAIYEALARLLRQPKAEVSA